MKKDLINCVINFVLILFLVHFLFILLGLDFNLWVYPVSTITFLSFMYITLYVIIPKTFK